MLLVVVSPLESATPIPPKEPSLAVLVLLSTLIVCRSKLPVVRMTFFPIREVVSLSDLASVRVLPDESRPTARLPASAVWDVAELTRISVLPVTVMAEESWLEALLSAISAVDFVVLVL